MKKTTTFLKGYKVFNPDFTCNKFQFKENTEFNHSGELKICNSGFHFCTLAQDCFKYYVFDPKNIVCEIEARGKILNHDNDSKHCTNLIFIGRRLTWQDVLNIVNSGANNTGHSNSGYSNSGNRNSGNRNSGNSNSGNSNSGYNNSGYNNSGNRNSGNSNSGDNNSGYRNSGYSNSGDNNSGHRNSGDNNSGYSNSGDSNSGNWNSGNSNSGNSNSGNRNSGNWNSGNWNSGNRNSGDNNSGYRNSGAFCTDNDPILHLFNKPTKIKVREWENHKAVELMYKVKPTIFVPMSIMTAKEKENHPKYETTEGYLKTISMKEAWANAWNNFTTESKKVFTDLPNFDAKIFEEITGIKISILNIIK